MDEMKMKPKTKKKICISILVFILIGILAISIYNIVKPKYKSLIEYEKFDKAWYRIEELGDYIFKDINKEIYDGARLRVYKVKDVDPDEMVIAALTGYMGGSVSYLCKAKDVDIDPLRDWEIEKITINDIEIKDEKLFESIRSDFLNDPLNEEDLDFAGDKKINISLKMYIRFKETSSIYARITVKEINGEFYCVFNDNLVLTYKILNNDVKKFIYDNFD